jgi:hypothetical protein
LRTRQSGDRRNEIDDEEEIVETSEAPSEPPATAGG